MHKWCTGHYCNSVIQGHCCKNLMKDVTDRHAPTRTLFFAYAETKEEHLQMHVL